MVRVPAEIVNVRFLVRRQSLLQLRSRCGETRVEAKERHPSLGVGDFLSMRRGEGSEQKLETELGAKIPRPERLSLVYSIAAGVMRLPLLAALAASTLALGLPSTSSFPSNPLSPPASSLEALQFESLPLSELGTNPANLNPRVHPDFHQFQTTAPLAPFRNPPYPIAPWFDIVRRVYPDPSDANSLSIPLSLLAE